jgi:DNA polymerase I-like protein with 3'-5' exonuclease and polymerase domains
MRGYKQLAHYSLLAANEAGRKGYVETLFGRRRYMHEFSANDPKSRARARRLAVNLETQGTAADIGKIALIRQEKARDRFDKEHQCKTYLCNFIHDSFLWEIPLIYSEPTKQREFIREFISVTREALTFDVRALTGIKDFPELKLDFKIGVNYQDMIEEARWLQVAEDGEYLGLPKMEYDAVKKAKQMEQHKGGEHVDSSDGHFVENVSGE